VLFQVGVVAIVVVGLSVLWAAIRHMIRRK
jgi:hypothetical protein